MTDTQKLLLEVLSIQYNKARKSLELTASEWISILTEAKYQATFLAAYSLLPDSLTSDSNFSEFERYKHYCIASNVRNLYYHNELHKLLCNEDIDYVVLKGQASAHYYPDPSVRLMGDVDFYVCKGSIERIDSLFQKQGFVRRQSADRHPFHWGYDKNKTSFEMHWGLPGMPENNSTLDKLMSNLLEERRLLQDSGKAFYIPSQFHHGLILLLHSIAHLTSWGIGLRHLYDWIVFENSFDENEFVDMFEQSLKNIGLWKYAQILSRTGSIYLGGKERDWCKEIDESVCKSLINDVLAGGNFGSNDSTRRSQTKFFRDNKTREIKDGHVIRNILTNLDVKSKRDYPLSGKCILLKPVAWTMVAGGHIFRVVRGKNHNELNRQIYNAARSRQRLYSAMELFVPED